MDRRARISAIVRQIAKKEEVPAPDVSLFESEFLDSFGLPDLVSALEHEYGITIPDADLNPRKFESIERIEEYLDSRG
ncbi:MAG: acyl carrier protein [Bryobacteraceae bacterium]|nr:acyl carrier protein [Bryobacteraceae bacterium]